MASRAVVACLLCLVSVEAAPRTRFPPSRFGIVAFDLNRPVPVKLAELGVGLVRGSCDWNDLEPARGVFNWDCADNVIVGAQQLGLRSYMTVGCTPGWANGGAGCTEMPSEVTDWYEFVASFVSRYTYYRTILGIWNEPNLSLRDTPAGANYALLFVNASNARNAVNSRFVLAGPDTSHHALANGYFTSVMDTIQFWKAMNPQDVVAVHWYSDGPPLPAYMDAVERAAGRQEVWLSETGFAPSDAAAQAGFYDTTLTTFVNSGRPWWTHIIFYRLWDGHDCCTEAIVQADYTSKPAFEMYRDWMTERR